MQNWAHPQMGCGADATSHITCHVDRHVTCFPCLCHVTSHVIVHINLHIIIAIYVISMSTATSSSMSSMCDMAIESVTKIILFVTFIFVIENELGLGLGGSGIFYDDFKTSWIKQSVTKI